MPLLKSTGRPEADQSIVKDFTQIVELSPDDLQGGWLVISAKWNYMSATF